MYVSHPGSYQRHLLLHWAGAGQQHPRFSLSLESSSHAAGERQRGSVKGLMVKNTGEGKEGEIEQSLGSSLILGSPGQARFDLVKERLQYYHSTHSLLTLFGVMPKNIGTFFFSCPVSDLVCSYLAVFVVSSQFYIRSSCNILSNQLLHFLFLFFSYHKVIWVCMRQTSKAQGFIIPGYFL